MATIALFRTPMKDSFYQKVHEVSTFDEKFDLCLENIEEFSDIIKKVQDVGEFNLLRCEIGLFSDILYNYIHNSRRSQCLLRKKFYDLCEKYPNGFNDCFNITKNKYVFYFSQFKKQEKKKKEKENENSSEN